MLFERARLSAEANRKIDQLMRVNGWSLEKALNELGIIGVASGATSAVGRSKAPVLQLVKKRASEMASEG
jgi:hypothetical protein